MAKNFSPFPPKSMFGETRTLALADLVEGSLMLKYNGAKRKAEKAAAA